MVKTRKNLVYRKEHILMRLLSTNPYFYMVAQMCTYLWNVLIPKILNLKIQQSK